MRGWILLLAGVCAFGQQQSFVACPMVRDTRTVPCFLAEYEGETYFLGTSQSERVPQLKHEVLVEGTVAEGPRVCGGIPLRPVAISVLHEVNLACNLLLPAEPGMEAPAMAARAADPERTSGAQEFVALYGFDDDHTDVEVARQAAEYAKRIGAGKVTVTGYRAASLLSDGRKLVEREGIAEQRAAKVEALLRGLGVKNVAAQSQKEAAPGDGQKDAPRRRVSIQVQP